LALLCPRIRKSLFIERRRSPVYRKYGIYETLLVDGQS
jgi:hypothetical protein